MVWLTRVERRGKGECECKGDGEHESGVDVANSRTIDVFLRECTIIMRRTCSNVDIREQDE